MASKGTVKIKNSIPVIKVREFAEGKSVLLVDTALATTSKAGIFFKDVADVTLFVMGIIREIFSPKFEYREFFHQCFKIGYKTVPLISITGAIMGLVLTIQTRPTLDDFGAVALLPGMVTVSLIREIGPVITALICAGKIGSGMGAELGSMRVTEQIDAMEVMAVNPIQYLVVPRVWATTLMLPVLSVLFTVVGMVGCYLVAVVWMNVDEGQFMSKIASFMETKDIISGIIKAGVFGAALSVIGCHKGFNAAGGAKGVGEATTQAVVLASVLIFVLDYVMTAIMF